MKPLLSFIFSLLITVVATAQKANIERTWFNEEKTSKIQIFKATDGKYYGKIVWLKEPNENGSPRLDKNNPDEKKRANTVQNMLILRSFKPTSDPAVYEEGTVYDPNNGKTYCGKITFKGNTLSLRGFICSVSFLGRSSTWTLAE